MTTGMPAGPAVADGRDALCRYAPVPVPEAAQGPLSGLTFCVKDLFDVAGYPTGCGHPLKLAQSPIATAHAPPVAALLAAGARFTGKTQLDELAYSLNGQNAHYGTPVNPAAPGRIPGGSSSGSSVAVAAGLADIGLGSDTGGSVRIPAAYCGLFGLRPTHGRIALDRAMPFAPSYDTVGWCTREPAALWAAGRVLLPPGGTATPASRLLLAEDCFALARPEAAAVLRAALPAVEAVLGPAEPVRVAGADGIGPWLEAFRVLQAAEIWDVHGAWVDRYRPVFGPGVRERFAMAAGIDAAERQAQAPRRAEARAAMHALLPPGTVLLLPTAPDIPPALDMPEAELDSFRYRALSLLCLAGHAGLPQLTMPEVAGRRLLLDGAPLGLSLLAGPGGDEMLLDLAARLSAD